MQARKLKTIPYLAVLPVALAAYLSPGIAQSETITYKLSNHPSSGDSPYNPYPVDYFGLRLDGLTTGDNYENYIFDFDHADSAMYLQHDDTLGTIHIYGSSFGGQDAESGAVCGVNQGTGPCIDANGDSMVDGTESVWTIDFTYNMVIPDLPDEGGFADVLVDETGSGMGTVSSPDFGTYTLTDHYSTDFLASFIFGDDAQVSQDTGVLTGWGWLDYCNPAGACTASSPLYTADWLFKATVVPVPAAVWLFGSGLLGLIAVARRRQV